MATTSPNSHSTTIEQIPKPSQTLSLLTDPMTIEANTSKTIANTQKQSAHTNAIEDYEPQHESGYCPEQEDLISFDPSEDQTKNFISPSQCKDFEELGGYNNSNPTFENVHNSSISDCTDFKQTIDNSEPKTETIDIQDQTSIIDNGDQDKSEL